MTLILDEKSITEIFKNEENIIQKSKEISNDIINEKLSIANFIECLGFALTSTSIELRVNGLKLLSNTLIQLPIDYLNEEQLRFIIDFYCERLKDHHNCIPSILDGILALIKMKYTINGKIEKFFRNFLQYTTCQSQLREDRYKFYLFIELITEKHYEELKAMKSDFIYGVINSINGERDPRNLSFIFNFMPNFIKKFPLYHLNEELYETLSCYFPIDFQPSLKSNDNTSQIITRDSLANGLANCLTASDEFIEWTIDLIIEKLGSDLITAKLDSLELLHRSGENFSSKLLDLHFDNIWNSLKLEIFPGSDNNDIILAGLKALNSILLNAFNTNLEISKNMQTTIFNTILQHLCDINHRLFEPSCKIAMICINADPLFASEKILNSLLLLSPNKLNKNEQNLDENISDNDNDQIEENIKYLNLLTNILQICNEKNTLKQLNTDLCKCIQNECKQLLNINGNNYHSTTIKKRNLLNEFEYIKSIINFLIECIQIINIDERLKFYKFLENLLLNDDNQINLSNIFKKIHINYNDELKQIINEILIKFPNYSLIIQEKIYTNFLIFVNNINENDDDFGNLILNLIINNIFNNDESVTIAQQKIALNALKMILTNESSLSLSSSTSNHTKISKIIQNLHLNYNLSDKIINLIIENKKNLPYDLLILISSILSLFIKQLNINEQKMILDKNLLNMNLSCRLTDIYLIKGLLGYMHENVIKDNLHENYEQFNKLLNDLIDISLNNDDENLRNISNHLLCSLFNKIDLNDNNTQNTMILKMITDKLYNETKNDNSRAVKILSWISKGLLIRGHSNAFQIIEMLTELLDHPTLSNSAIKSFEILSSQYSELHLPNLKFLFQQKFFHIFLNKIWDKLKIYSENHMNAFIYVLKTVPNTVIKMNLEKIGPVLFKCLEIENISTIHATLEILKNFLQEQHNYFRNHLNHLIPQLLKLTQNQNSMKIRSSSLECLSILCKYPTFILLPYKYTVLHGLIPSLDDKKRLVRNLAVKARNLWFLIG